MFLCNAHLPSGSLADVEIADGVIAAVRPPTSADPSDHWIDVDERLVLPAFVEGHVHLDKTHWGAPRLPHVEGRSVRERIAAERVARHHVALPIDVIQTLRGDARCRAY